VILEQVDVYTLRLLGVEPLLGRWFQPDETIVQGNTSQTIVISYGMWQRIFGGDPNVVGKKLPGFTAGWGETVIGVMPRGFYVHPSRSNSDGWYVITQNPGRTLGRLAAGVSAEQAQAELEGMARGQQPETPGPRTAANSWRIQVIALHEAYRSGYAQTLYLLLGAVGFVLLIAAVNVANLQLNRGVTRQSEIATRIALGAGSWRLFRQLLIENVILVLVGGALGIFVAFVGIRLFVTLAPNFYPPSEEIGIDGTVLLFTLGVCIATGILSGVVPGLRATKFDLHGALKQAGRGADRGMRLGRRALVVSEIGLAMVLLIGAGLMINSYARATGVQMGLDPDNVLRSQTILMGMDRYRTRFSGNHSAATPAVSQFYAQVLERLAVMPGVESVGLTSVLPPGGGLRVRFRVLGGKGLPDDSAADYHEVSAGFFNTMRVPVLRGRAFSERDTEAAAGAIIVNETFARRFFPGEDPIGQSIQAQITAPNPKLQPDRVREVVGVVGDVRMDFRAEFVPIMYVPYQQHLTDYPGNNELAVHTIKTFVVRTSSDPMSIVPAVRRVFAEADSRVAVGGLMPMRASLSAAADGQAFWMRLLGIFAALGVFLAAVGIYGVVSYSVEQRTREFGIRATLGAQNSDILKLVLREGIGVTVIGLVLGLAGAFASTRLIQNQLFGVSRMDPLTISTVAFVLVTISLLACLIPAWRTTKLDPLLALRVE
jgi:putative ABC transport system permease protein